MRMTQRWLGRIWLIAAGHRRIVVGWSDIYRVSATGQLQAGASIRGHCQLHEQHAKQRDKRCQHTVLAGQFHDQGLVELNAPSLPRSGVSEVSVRSLAHLQLRSNC